MNYRYTGRFSRTYVPGMRDLRLCVVGKLVGLDHGLRLATVVRIHEREDGLVTVWFVE